MAEFYQEGHTAVTAVDWVKYFIEVAEIVDMPGLNMLEKVCRKYLGKHDLSQPAVEPELLPSSLARGSR